MVPRILQLRRMDMAQTTNVPYRWVCRARPKSVRSFF
jgi:hypothetical protein